MKAQRHLGQLNALRDLQRAERDSAAMDHVAACRAADAAQAALAQANEEVRTIAERWYAARATGHFSPEFDRVIGQSLIQAEASAEVRALNSRRADAERDRKEEDWRLNDARNRATDRILRDARRKIARARDNKPSDPVARRNVAGTRS